MSDVVTFDEMEETAKPEAAPPPPPPPAPDLNTIKAEGEAIPEHLRGKSAAEIIAYTTGLEKSLRASESARKTQSDQPDPAPAAKPGITIEELKELWDKDPIQATALIVHTSQQQLLENLDRRLKPLSAGSVESAKSEAARRYPEEFALFGDQINDAVAAVTDKSALSRPEAWEDLVSWIRGRPGNFEKLVEARAKKAATNTLEDAQGRAAATAPTTPSSAMRAPAPKGGNIALDDVQLEIARNLNMTPEEYVKWSKVL